MGCASSKKIGATTPDVYRPSSTSFAVFDINAIEEPWLKLGTPQQKNQDKSSHLPPPILEKLSSFEQQPSDAPRTWDEISKALEVLKPVPDASTTPPKRTAAAQPTVPLDDVRGVPNMKTPGKSISFHTLEELDAKLKAGSANPNKQTELRKTDSTRDESTRSELTRDESWTAESFPRKDSGGFKPVRDNVFILRDRMEREREGKASAFDRIKKDPLSQFPEKCPPGGANSVVLYTTSLRGVRRTFEDCNAARSVLETHRVVFDERNVSLHGEFLHELRELMGSEEAEGRGVVPVPRLFVKGRYLGGVEEVVELNESGRLGRILSWARVERGVQGCEGCGGASFVPCFECSGSCKVLVGEKREKGRCPKCNENGLVQCPLCRQIYP
ncbi:hypothetical protein Ancab_032857 [Ancistrocladus abbreviatus]